MDIFFFPTWKYEKMFLSTSNISQEIKMAMVNVNFNSLENIAEI